jgi:hypothetical protein
VKEFKKVFVYTNRRTTIMTDDFLFVKGCDVGRKNNRRFSDPAPITGVEKTGDVLFIRGTDVCKRNSVRDL